MLDVTAYGRIATKLELKQSKGIKYVNFLLATHDHGTSTFIRCVAFGVTASVFTTYCCKGDRILLTGELIPDKYEDKIDTFKIKVSHFDFIETKKESEEHNYDDIGRTKKSIQSDK